MKKEEQMRKIVESVDGGCWHDIVMVELVSQRYCRKCRKQDLNPSPTDLNEISRLEAKLLVGPSVVLRQGEDYSATILNLGETYIATGTTEVDARRTALYQSVKGEG